MMFDVLNQGAAFAETLKKAVKLANDLKDVELQESLVSLREYLVQIREDNVNLRNENKDLRQQLQQRDEMVWERNLYWKPDRDKRIGPYCPRCFDGSERVTRMTDTLNDEFYRCTVCAYISRKDAMRGW